MAKRQKIIIDEIKDGRFDGGRGVLVQREEAHAVQSHVLGQKIALILP